MDNKKLIEDIKYEILNNSHVTNELLLLMLENIGSIDPVLRDETIYLGFNYIYKNKIIDLIQKNIIIDYIFNNNLLSKGINDVNSDLVFTRSFTSLLLVIILEYNYEDEYINESLVINIINQVFEYLNKENDNRGLVLNKGWAHAFAHGADLIGSLSKSKYFTSTDGNNALSIIKRAILDIEGLLYGEEGRLAKASTLLIKNNKVSIETFINWFNKYSEKSISLKTNEQFKNYSLALIYNLKFEKINNLELIQVIENYLEEYYQVNRSF